MVWICMARRMGLDAEQHLDTEVSINSQELASPLEYGSLRLP
jgi:hypothetical protein